MRGVLRAVDDKFYSLEARNVRDRTKFEEMSKAKNKAEEERSIYRLMVEQHYEVRRTHARRRLDRTRLALGNLRACVHAPRAL